MDITHYTYRITWSSGDDEFVATCAEFPLLSWLAPDPDEALQQLRAVVSDAVADMESEGEPVPQPYSERNYSGRVLVRMSSDLHRKLVIEANEKNVSLNHHILEKLRS